MRIRVDPGLEYLLPFAKKKLREHTEQVKSGIAPLSRIFHGDGFSVYVQAGQFPEIRIEGGVPELLFANFTPLSGAPALQGTSQINSATELLSWQFYQEIGAPQPFPVISIQEVIPLAEVLSQPPESWNFEYGMALADGQSFVIQSGSGAFKNYLDPSLNTPPRTTGTIEWTEGGLTVDWPATFRTNILQPTLSDAVLRRLADAVAVSCQVDGTVVTAYSMDYVMRGSTASLQRERRSAGYYDNVGVSAPGGFSTRMIQVRLLAVHEYLIRESSAGIRTAEFLRSTSYSNSIEVADLLALPQNYDMHMGPIAFVARPKRWRTAAQTPENDMRRARNPLTAENPALFDVHTQIIQRIRASMR